MGEWFSIHSHSHYSVLDGTTPVEALVRRAKALDYPALGMTDHGNMAATTQLYVAGKKYGIPVFPGFEGYLLDPTSTLDLNDKQSGKVQRYHFGMLALNENGYKGLVKLNSLSHTRPRYNKFPRHTIDDLLDFGDEYGEDVIFTTGCFFGYVQQMLAQNQFIVAESFVEGLSDVFSNLYVEVQHHNIDHAEDGTGFTDDQMVRMTFKLADNLGLPVIATGDNHYLTPMDKPAHSLMKEMVYGSPEDAFPGDGFFLPHEDFVASHYTETQWNKILESCNELVDLHDLTIPALDTYRPRVPTIKKDADKALRVLANTQLIKMMTDKIIHVRRRKKYEDRLEYELGVIKQIGFANYFLLWDIIVKWCRNEGICIEARGSANGSLVCFVMGITQVDPIKFGVTFDRFLSIDRIKPPDIDMDIEDVRRMDLIYHLRDHYDVTQIGTWSHLGSSIDDEGDEKGSVLVSFRTYLAREAGEPYEQWRRDNRVEGHRNLPTDKAMAAQAKEDRDLVYSMVQTMDDVKRFFPSQYPALAKLAKMGSVFRSYGVHAGGVLLSGDDLKIEDWIPTMLVASSETIVSQYDMDAVETWGLLKLDILGQRSLAIMRMCQEIMGRDNVTDFTWIPDDDPAAMVVLKSGVAGNGVFHAEGYSKAKGYKLMKPRSVREVIAGTALFMPGAMDTGQTNLYLQRRADRDLRDSVKYPHQVFKDVLAPTYGALIYQEQMLNIMRGLGMDIATINTLFKIVKDSGKGAQERNRERIRPIKKLFDDICAANGVQGSYDDAWNGLIGIVAYAFNQAHATGYGIRTYRFAYLKANYPLEFHTALLAANAGTKKKEQQYIIEVHRQGIPMLPPDINVSGENWTYDRQLGAIRKGLRSIPGVGPAATPVLIANAPYSSVEDIATKCQSRAISGRTDLLDRGVWAGTMKALKEAHALDSLLKGK